MGIKNITKEIKQRTLSDIVIAAKLKYPGLSLNYAIYQYNLLVKEIYRVKRDPNILQDVHLSQLLVNAINYYFKDGRN